MKDINIQKGIEQIKKVSLTNKEKSKMLHNLSLYADVHQPIPVTHSLFAFFNISLNRKLATVMAAVMISVILGGSAVYASEQSLPGELLYPIKTKISEPVRIALAKTPKEKARIETELAGKRLEEAEKLEKRGKLTQNLNKVINKKFDSHVSDFYKIKKQIEKKDTKSSQNEDDDIQEEFENRMNSYPEILNRFNRDSNGLEKAIKKDIKNYRENITPLKQLDNRNASSVDTYRKAQFQNED